MCYQNLWTDNKNKNEHQPNWLIGYLWLRFIKYKNYLQWKMFDFELRQMRNFKVDLLFWISIRTHECTHSGYPIQKKNHQVQIPNTITFGLHNFPSRTPLCNCYNALTAVMIKSEVHSVFLSFLPPPPPLRLHLCIASIQHWNRQTSFIFLLKVLNTELVRLVWQILLLNIILIPYS